MALRAFRAVAAERRTARPGPLNKNRPKRVPPRPSLAPKGSKDPPRNRSTTLRCGATGDPKMQLFADFRHAQLFFPKTVTRTPPRRSNPGRSRGRRWNREGTLCGVRGSGARNLKLAFSAFSEKPFAACGNFAVKLFSPDLDETFWATPVRPKDRFGVRGFPVRRKTAEILRFSVFDMSGTISSQNRRRRQMRFYALEAEKHKSGRNS